MEAKIEMAIAYLFLLGAAASTSSNRLSSSPFPIFSLTSYLKNRTQTMLLYAANPTRWSMKCPTDCHVHSKLKAPNISNHTRAVVSGVATALLVLSSTAGAVPEPETLSNIPQTLSSVCSADEKDCKKRYKIQRPKSKKAEACTSKCSSTCMQGGFGSPGEGPFNTLSPLVVFKDGFRSRKYCLSECSDICNLIADRDGDDGR